MTRFSSICSLAALAVVLAGPLSAEAAIDHTEIQVEVIWYDPSAGEGGGGAYVSAVYNLAMRDNEAPLTVDNFKAYINSGEYNFTVIHRSAHSGPGDPFVVQGGGFWVDEISGQLQAFGVTTLDPIDSEFDPATMSNLRGTLAMARLGNDQNSATSQWFVNMTDNTGLDYATEPTIVGFTVFGDVIDTPVDPGMDFLDAIADLPTYNFGVQGVTPQVLAWTELPLVNYTQDDYFAAVPLQFGNLLYTVMTITDEPLIGDGNRDDQVSLLDIPPFINALMTGVYQTEMDISRDGMVSLLDIPPFINLLVGAGEAQAVVPEPGSLTLLVGAGLLLGVRRRSSRLLAQG